MKETGAADGPHGTDRADMCGEYQRATKKRKKLKKIDEQGQSSKKEKKSVVELKPTLSRSEDSKQHDEIDNKPDIAAIAASLKKMKKSAWKKLIVKVLNEKGVEWEGYKSALSLKRLKKEVVSRVAVALGCGTGGERGAALKVAYDENFKPGSIYEVDEDRCVLLSEDEGSDQEQQLQMVSLV